MVERHKEPSAMKVQICYARPDSQTLIDLTVAAGTNVEQAIRQSGMLEKTPEINLLHNRVGIFGKLKPLDTPLREGDRVEIYRPLEVDPKEARRLRARRKAGE